MAKGKWRVPEKKPVAEETQRVEGPPEEVTSAPKTVSANQARPHLISPMARLPTSITPPKVSDAKPKKKINLVYFIAIAGAAIALVYFLTYGVHL